MARSLYLYRYLNDNKISQIDNTDGLIISERWPIIGVDPKIYKGKRMRNLERELELKQFVIEQKNFDLFIKLSSSFKEKVLLNSIEFTEQITIDEESELKEYIVQKKNDEILSFVDKQRYDMFRDIENLKFTMRLNSINRITISSMGVLSMDSNSNEEVTKLLSTQQFGIIIGVNLENLGAIDG